MKTTRIQRVRPLRPLALADYRFARVPSNGSIATLVTFLVSAWFFVAGAAILADPHSPYTERAAQAAPAEVEAAAQAQPAIAAGPAFRQLVTVEAQRG